MRERLWKMRDEWLRLALSRKGVVIERAFRPRRCEVIPVLAAMTDVSESWLRAECDRTSLEGMLFVLGVVTDRDGGAAYWERLCAREVLPVEWLEDPTRAFFSRRTEVDRAELDPADARPPPIERRHYVSQPLRALDALSLACDASTLSTVESLAREAAQRVARVTNAAQPATVARWHVVRNSGATENLVPWRSSLFGDAGAPSSVEWPAERLVTDESRGALVREVLATPAVRAMMDSANTRERATRQTIEWICSAIERSCAWTVLSDERVREDSDERYGDFLDPYEPLVAVIEAGYAVERFDVDGLCLIAPSL